MFNKLEKVLFIIDNGLVDTIIGNLPKKKKESIKNRLYKKVNIKINQILIFPLSLLFKKGKRKNELCKNWLIYESVNNYNALLTLEKGKNIFIKPNKDIIYKKLIFYKIIYAIPLFFWLLKNNKLRWYFMFYDALGIVEESERLIKKFKPLKLVFANDINPYQVALKMAGKKYNIPVYYIQHASISKYMPPLDFTVVFLEGQAALDKYKEIGKVNSKVELIGMIKYQESKFKLNTNKKVKSIGIALNMLDDIVITEKFLYDLNKIFPLVEIYVRMHPRDKRKFFLKDLGLKYSDAKKENIFSFLSKIDLLIGSETSTHLEAALLNVIPVYYKFSNNSLFDVYGYIKNGLVYHAKDKKSLYNFIQKQLDSKLDVLNRTVYYNEYIKTKVNYKKILYKYGL